MHILHINLAKGVRDGERQTQLLIQALAPYGVKQTLACRKDSPLRQLLAATEVNFIDIEHPLKRWWEKIDADIIQAHETKAAYWAYLHTRFFPMPYVVTRRVDHPLKQSLKHRLMYGKAAAVVGLSRVIADALTPFNANCHIIPSAQQALPMPQPNADLKALAKKGWLIGHIGALVDKHKGQALLIEAVNRHPEWQLALVGGGEDEAKLKALAHDNIHFIGQVNDVMPYLAAFDVFAFPSRKDSTHALLLEAMHYAKPIVATAVGGISDSIHDQKNGLLVPPNDADALEGALLRLHARPQFAQQLALQAQRDAEHYTPHAMAEKYMTLYQEILS